MRTDSLMDDIPSSKTPSMSTASPDTKPSTPKLMTLEDVNEINDLISKDHKLEYVYTWFKDNRDKFKPALDDLPRSFLDKNGIESTMEVMVVDARDPEFDTQILYT